MNTSIIPEHTVRSPHNTALTNVTLVTGLMHVLAVCSSPCPTVLGSVATNGCFTPSLLRKRTLSCGGTTRRQWTTGRTSWGLLTPASSQSEQQGGGGVVGGPNLARWNRPSKHPVAVLGMTVQGELEGLDQGFCQLINGYDCFASCAREHM